MKKLMFSTAAIMALSLSAFAGTPETKGEAKPAESQSKVNDTPIECYLDANNEFRVKQPGGRCITSTGKYCTYLYNGPELNPEDDQDASHYQVDPLSAGYNWQP